MVRTLSTPWRSLGLTRGELNLAHTLPTGQAFGWRRAGDEYHGVLGDAALAIRENPTTRCAEWRSALDKEATTQRRLDDYFRTDTSFEALYGEWSSCDERFAQVAPAVAGARVLRQDPFECLISFICSSNNNIARITLMLTRLREGFGMKVELPALDDVPLATLHSFPTPEVLTSIDAQVLRDLGFGYRAPYVVKTCQTIVEKGGAPYLSSLRTKTRREAKVALMTCAGVGPKVADCVALFSLDQAACVPVDTHVWRIARRDYDATLEDCASITPTVYERVGDLFRDRFGATAGWAHAVLFAAELPAYRAALPEAVVAEMDAFREEEKKAGAAQREARKARVAAKKGETPPKSAKPAKKAKPVRKPTVAKFDAEADADLVCRPKKSPAKKPAAKKPAPRKPAPRKPAPRKPAARKPAAAKQAATPAAAPKKPARKAAKAAKKPRAAKPRAAKPKARRKAA